MVLTGPGIRLDLIGPRPVAPPHSLLNTPGVVVEGESTRWMNGVSVIGYPEGVPALWEPCSEGTFRAKDEGEGRPEAQFDPFVVYLAAMCSTFGASDLAEQAQAVLDATASLGVEQGLASGVDGSINPFFGDANLTVLGGAAVSAATGLAYLENAIGATGRKGMIHATPATVSVLSLDKVDPHGSLETANGTPVVSGDGYIGSDPVAEASPDTGQDYMYATGPVEVRLGPVQVQPLREALDRSDNTVVFRAEQIVLPIWDTALQVAVLVDWSP
jgi:hypothetical protein